MELGINIQLYAVICAMLTGLNCGAVYDVLRVLRRRLGMDALFDILYCSFVLFALFTLGMDMGGGSLHIIMLLSAACAFALYMSLMSRTVLYVLGKIFDLVGLLLSPVKEVGKKLKKLAENLFSNAKKWFRILKKSFRKADDPEDADPQYNGDNTCDADGLCGAEPRRRRKRSKTGADDDG